DDLRAGERRTGHRVRRHHRGRVAGARHQHGQAALDEGGTRQGRRRRCDRRRAGALGLWLHVVRRAREGRDHELFGETVRRALAIAVGLCALAACSSNSAKASAPPRPSTTTTAGEPATTKTITVARSSAGCHAAAIKAGTYERTLPVGGVTRKYQ